MEDNGTDYNLVGALMDYEAGALDGAGILALFSHLISTGTAYVLQGHYGRQADALINSGWLDSRGNILQDPPD